MFQQYLERQDQLIRDLAESLNIPDQNLIVKNSKFDTVSMTVEVKLSIVGSDADFVLMGNIL